MRDEESAGSRRGNSRQDPSASADTPDCSRTQLHAGAAAASGTSHVTSPSPVELGATKSCPYRVSLFLIRHRQICPTLWIKREWILSKWCWMDDTRVPRAPAMKRSVGLNVTSHRGHDPKGVPRSLDKLIARIEKKMAPV